MDKTLVILTEGGRDMGFGHVTRCLSLAQAFVFRGYTCHFIIDGDDSVHSVMGDMPYKICDWTGAKEISYLEDADLVIVDSYIAEAEIYRNISRMVPVALYLDDTLRLDYPQGVVVNWSIAALEMDYATGDKVSCLLGPQYISLREAFWDLETKPVSREVSTVMVTFGGDDSKNITPVVLQWLVENYPQIKKNVIIGNAFKNQQQIESVMDSRTNLVFSPDAQGMKEVMQESDLAISSGGQTLYELACVGVPAIVVAVAENQLSNVAGWQKTGFIQDAGFWTDIRLLNRIERNFEILSDYKRRIEAIAAGRAAVPGNGADRIIDYIEKNYKTMN